MKNNKLNVSLILLFIILLIGCSTPAAITQEMPGITPSPVLPTSTIKLTSTLKPTSTATTPPIIQPDEYLLEVEELPFELFKSYENIYLQSDGSLTYSILFFNAGVGGIINSITVAEKPFSEFPDLKNYILLDFYSLNELKDPEIEINAKAFGDGSRVAYFFYKGNSLIQISRNLSLKQAIALGRIIADRLPEQLPILPILFPNDLDSSTFNAVMRSITVVDQCIGGTPEPKNIFTMSDSGFCLLLDVIATDQKYQYAIFDLEKGIIVQKFIPGYGFNNNWLMGVHHPGNYEFWVSANGVLISKIPFEVK